MGQIADIDKAQIREIEHPFDDTKPTGKKSIFSTLKGTPLRPKGLYFFEIVLPNRTWRLSAPDQQTIKDWIEAIDDAAKRQLSREAAYSAPQGALTF